MAKPAAYSPRPVVLRAASRGRLVDYCPDCGTSHGQPCETPKGQVRADHRARTPECNRNWDGKGCNLHAGACPDARPETAAPSCTCGSNGRFPHQHATLCPGWSSAWPRPETEARGD